MQEKLDKKIDEEKKLVANKQILKDQIQKQNRIIYMKKINEIIKNRKEEIEKVDKSDMAARDEYWKQIEAEIKVGRIAEK